VKDRPSDVFESHMTPCLDRHASCGKWRRCAAT
jgi:hypothetical protein